MTTTYHRHGDGAQVSEFDAVDARGCIKDGYSVKTRMTMMDSAPSNWDSARTVHALVDAAASAPDPHRVLTDDEKVARIDRLNAKLSDAWRNPTPLPPASRELGAIERGGAAKSPPQQSDKSSAPDMDAVYAKRDRQLEDAWR